MNRLSLMILLFAAPCWAQQPVSPEVDVTPLPVRAVRAFPELTFQRPILLTHAGDGTNRVFVASQLGKVFVFPNTADVEEAELFFDLSGQVVYKDKENEEGFLGMAFHPNYKTNGEFFVYYTTTDAPHTSVVSRFRVSNDPNHADVSTEEELLRIEQPFWNHNGGTLVFGPDGFLYIALGDGGKADDPFGNGQNLQTLLGSLLRIDVDSQSDGKPYGIPADNPFIKTPGARPEIYAYGFRNPWRFSFDRKTNALWLADVGQNLWEEIDIVTKGGNYGWNEFEALHPFPPTAKPTSEPLDKPIWEYNHDIGKSITGGFVYRGTQTPALAGMYLYADYVSGRLWALNYDADAKTVVGNHPLDGHNHPVMSYGEDEQGEVYFMTPFGQLWRFAGK